METLIDNPRYSTAEVASAAGLPPATLQNWLARKMLETADFDDSPGTGRARQFSFRRALHIALVAELVRHGVSVSRASFIALGYTDFGNALGYYGDAPSEEDLKNFRAPGQPFQSGTTLLVVRPPLSNGNEAENVSVIRVEKGQVPLFDVFASRPEENASAIVVNMTILSKKLKNALPK